MPKLTGKKEKKKEVLQPTKSSSRLKEKAQAREMEDAISAMDQISDSEFEDEIQKCEAEDSSKLEKVLEEGGEVNSSPLIKNDVVVKTIDHSREVNEPIMEIVVEPTVKTVHTGNVENQHDPMANIDAYAVPLGNSMVTNPLSLKETVPKQPFASLFKDNREPSKGMKLRYIEPVGEFIDLSKRIMPSITDLWGFCLVGYFAGRFPGIRPIQEFVAKWGVQCHIRQHDRGWVIFKFNSEEARGKILMEGPYSLFGKSLYLKVLSDDFAFDSEEFLKVPIWVKFPFLPMQVWDEEVISEIASRVGLPLTTDRVTQEKARSNFARVLIEVDASKPSPLRLRIKMPNGRFH
ncbi:unnamed protein product [Cuscuta epithymum]|uniref:DUF4283 domain-containing protein n=1 Tax=Cuscuta epithymum TaxID=186058 RepID=A0AAV0FI66_9ASTE|nr:unnamed protein product [Cuscuta epithymum]